ncbi:transposase InsO family protein [Bradyrhizobium ottawaense]
MRPVRIERRSIGRPPSCASRPGRSIICWRVIGSTGGCRRCCHARTARGRSGLTMKSRKSLRRPCRRKWLTLEAPPLAPVVAEIRARCEEAGLAAPSYGAVDRRIRSLFSPEEIAKKRSANPKHLLRLKPRPGYIRASKPLEVCQIDHTPTDIHFVEVVEGEGVFVGRAYLTLVADVATRSILGFCLTLEKPSALSVALCLAQAMCPKEDWLAARGIEHRWPMFGRPQQLVTDSAKEFKGRAFQRGCEDYGIRIRYRDRGRVHEGGVIERLLGKLNAVLAMHPGSTGRSVADRDGYPAERRARLSFADLERCVALAVIDHNLQQNAKTLKAPAAEWAQYSRDLPRFEDDAARVVLAFLPGTERRLSPQGVSMFALDYYSPWLGCLVPQRDRLGRLEVRYDPPRHQPHLCPGSGNEGVSVRRTARWVARSDDAVGARRRPRSSTRRERAIGRGEGDVAASDRRDRRRIEAFEGRPPRRRTPDSRGGGQQAL